MFHVGAVSSSRKRIAAIALLVVVAMTTAWVTMNKADAANQPKPNYNMDARCGDNWPGPPDFRAFESFHIYVNGKEIPKTSRLIDKYVKEGDDISIKFKLKAICNNTYVGISYYHAPAAKFIPSRAGEQVLADRADGVYPAGKEITLSIDSSRVPSCYYQVDINTGFEYKPGDYRLDKMGRLLFAAVGGDNKCPAPKPTTTSSTTSSSTTSSTTTPPKVHKASATAARVCKDDASGWEVTYRNEGNVAEELVLRSGNGDIIETVELQPGKTMKKTYLFEDFDVAAGETIEITVEMNDETVAELEVTNDCVKPAATIEQECAQDATGFTVTYENEGETDQTFELMLDGEVVDTVIVEAGGEPVEKRYDFDDEKIGIGPKRSAKLEVIANDQKIATESVTNDCVEATAKVVAECDTEKGTGAVFTFINSGRVEERFSVSVAGNAIDEPVAVAAGQTKIEFFDMVEDTTLEFTIEGQISGFVMTQTVPVNCEEVAPVTIVQAPPVTSPPVTAPPVQVLGQQVTQPQPQLAQTGITTTPYITLGTLLLMAGSALLGLSRRLRIS